ncbi:hypothetical protein [Anaerolentibacter hominis]|uniref:hypothetical protein n=1 Tax=Anaerolentibacter hominis TaxID=3079009 RepID=UPI0031B84D6A
MSAHTLPVDVIAVFNPSGEVKPLFLQAEGAQYSLLRLKINRVLSVREEQYGGIRCFHYVCETILPGDRIRLLDIYYHIDTHRWLLKNPPEL